MKFLMPVFPVLDFRIILFWGIGGYIIIIREIVFVDKRNQTVIVTL